MDPGFRDPHWPGLRSRSQPFGLAAPYVFIKQSGPPCHCDLRSQAHGPRPQAPLLPRVRGQFAEFPRPEYPPDALGSSPRGTSVGSWYGHGGSFPLPFSPAPGPSRSLHTEAPSRLHLVLAITALPRLMRLDRATARLGLPRGVRERACVAAPTPVAPES